MSLKPQGNETDCVGRDGPGPPSNHRDTGPAPVAKMKWLELISSVPGRVHTCTHLKDYMAPLRGHGPYAVWALYEYGEFLHFCGVFRIKLLQLRVSIM